MEDAKGSNAATPRRDARLNRERLLLAAREVFATQGITVTLDDIARHAGVGVGTAYRNFANKGELIDALLVGKFDEMVALAEDGLRDPDPWAGLRGFLEAFLARQQADRGLKQVLHEVAHSREPVQAARRRLAPAVGALVERAKAAGVVRDDVAASDISFINFMLGTVIELSRDVQPELYRRYLDLLLDSLRPSAPAPAVGPLSAEQLLAAMERGPQPR
jgi:AcrR family transcriptional regulator